MEIIQSRYGLDRTIEKIDSTRIRVTGESQFQRISTDESGEVTMFDFEGGPGLSVGGDILYQNLKWKIRAITPVQTSHEGLCECILTVHPNY